MRWTTHFHYTGCTGGWFVAGYFAGGWQLFSSASTLAMAGPSVSVADDSDETTIGCFLLMCVVNRMLLQPRNCSLNTPQNTSIMSRGMTVVCVSHPHRIVSVSRFWRHRNVFLPWMCSWCPCLGSRSLPHLRIGQGTGAL